MVRRLKQPDDFLKVRETLTLLVAAHVMRENSISRATFFIKKGDTTLSILRNYSYWMVKTLTSPITTFSVVIASLSSSLIGVLLMLSMTN